MRESMNTPYVKHYDKNGNVSNPIIGSYVSEFDNRRTRREHLNQIRFIGCGNNHHLTVTQTMKYHRFRQIITQAGGIKKTIEHYLTK